MVQATPNPSGRGSRYHLTEAGKDLGNVMAALGTWGERWIELTPGHVDAGMVLWAWANRFLAREHLPGRRVVVQFDFRGLRKQKARHWMIFVGERTEVCATYPGVRGRSLYRGGAQGACRMEPWPDHMGGRPPS